MPEISGKPLPRGHTELHALNPPQPRKVFTEAQFAQVANLTAEANPRLVLSRKSDLLVIGPLIGVVDQTLDCGVEHAPRWRGDRLVSLGSDSGSAYGYGEGGGWDGPLMVTVTYDRIPEGTGDADRVRLGVPRDAVDDYPSVPFRRHEQRKIRAPGSSVLTV